MDTRASQIVPLLCVLSALALAPFAAAAVQCAALVIGNATYEAETPLVNTLNDARDVAAALEGLGLAVRQAENLGWGGSKIPRQAPCCYMEPSPGRRRATTPQDGTGRSPSTSSRRCGSKGWGSKMPSTSCPTSIAKVDGYSTLGSRGYCTARGVPFPSAECACGVFFT